MELSEAAHLVLRALGERTANQGPFGVDAKVIGAATGLSAGRINDAVQYLKTRGLVESFTGVGTSDGYDFLHVRLTAEGRDAYARAEETDVVRSEARRDGQGNGSGIPRNAGMDNNLKQQIEAAGWQVWDPVTPKATGGGQCFFCCRTSAAESLGRALFAAHASHSFPGVQHYRPALMDWFREMWTERVRLDDLVGVVKVAHAPDARFDREVRVLKTLQHPNLIRVYAHDQASPPKWYVMQLHEGGDLGQKRDEYHNNSDPMALGRPTFEGSISEVMRRLRGVAEALSVLHRGDGKQKIIHRDIKPGNILVAADGRWILTDLGIALDTEGERLTGTELQLSRDWRPDWVVRGEYTERMDIEMLAKVAYYLIAGVKPPPLSQFRLDRWDIRKLQPGVAGTDELHSFLNDHIGANESDIKSRTAVDFIAAVDELLERLSREPEPRLLYSFTSGRRESDVLNETLENTFGNIPVYLSSRTRLVTARVRVHEGSAVFWFTLERGSERWTSDEMPVQSNSSAYRGTWTPVPITLRVGRPLESGEYALTLHCKGASRDSTSITAFIAHAV